MHGKNVSVLVVDDESSLLDAYSRNFAHAGLRCVAAQSGEDALARLASESIQVVITDLSMPGMSGADFMRSVREQYPELPIIVVTGHPGLSNIMESIDAGVFRYLTKPVDAAELLAAVGDAVNARALAQARRAAFAHLAGPDSKSPPPLVVERAMENMWLALQPIVSTAEKRVVGYEALLRTSDTALRDPATLMAAAERLDILPVVGRSIRGLAAAIVPNMPVDADLFINMHPYDLLDQHLFSESDPLRPMAQRVVFELTERSALETVPDARGRIATLRQMGYRIALDDMGAGYAGLTSFAMLKPDFVKLDVTLVRDVDEDPMRQALIRALINLAGELGIIAIAEGVETIPEREALILLGCTRQQGYLFARPGLPFPAVDW